MEMDRKGFLKTSVAFGSCCGMALLSAPKTGLAEDAPCSSAPPDPRLSTCQQRMEQGQKVIKRILSQLDDKLDEPTRARIMESCGRACYEGSTPDPKRVPSATEAHGFLDYMMKNFRVDESSDETVVQFKYTSNPRGLKTTDGYCLCPIFELPPKDVSSTYCQCSVGYVTAFFERGLGKPAKVELKESILRGGKGCSFEVRFKTA